MPLKIYNILAQSKNLGMGKIKYANFDMFPNLQGDIKHFCGYFVEHEA